jgi:serine/threonine-protein kinase RsbW
MHLYDNDRHFHSRAVDLALEERAQGPRVHTPVELRPFLDRLEDRMRVLGYPCRDLFAVRPAASEAATNAFRHGNLGDPTRTINLRYLVTAAGVLVEVEDQGPGFDPRQVPDPLTEQNLHWRGGAGACS